MNFNIHKSNKHLICPTDPEDWRKIEDTFRNRWNALHAVGALDDIDIKKLKKSGRAYFNHKGYFSLVPLALVDANYKFLWVNVVASGSSSDATTRTTWNWGGGRSTLLPLGGRCLCLYALVGKALQQKTTDWRRQNIQPQDIQGRRVVKNTFGILVGRFRVLLTTLEQRPKVVRDIVLTCAILHNKPLGEQTDHPLQPMTYNHHRMIRGNRDRMKTLEIYRGRLNISVTYRKTTSVTFWH